MVVNLQHSSKNLRNLYEPIRPKHCPNPYHRMTPITPSSRPPQTSFLNQWRPELRRRLCRKLQTRLTLRQAHLCPKTEPRFMTLPHHPYHPLSPHTFRALCRGNGVPCFAHLHHLPFMLISLLLSHHMRPRCLLLLLLLRRLSLQSLWLC